MTKKVFNKLRIEEDIFNLIQITKKNNNCMTSMTGKVFGFL